MDKRTFSQRVLALEGRMYRISYGMLRNPQDSMDAVQEAVLKAWARLPQLRNEAYFETWLTRILINECHNLQNKRGTVPLDALGDRPAPPEGANRPLHDALMVLDGELRLPVVLHYMEGYKLREIAQLLKLPEGTVKTRLARAKRKLKLLLDAAEEE